MIREFLETQLGAYLFSFVVLFALTVDPSDPWIAVAGSAFFSILGMIFVPVLTYWLPFRSE